MLAAAPCLSWAQAWIAPGDPGLRRLVERLVDERALNLPTLDWPIPRRDLESALERARTHKDLAPRTLTDLIELETRLGVPSTRSNSKGTWSIAAGNPTDLRGFVDAPRARGAGACATPACLRR